MEQDELKLNIDEQKYVLCDNVKFIKTEDDIQDETIDFEFETNEIKKELGDIVLLDQTIKTEDTYGVVKLEPNDDETNSEKNVYFEKNIDMVDEVCEENLNQNKEVHSNENENCVGLDSFACISVEKSAHLEGNEDQKHKNINKETYEDLGVSCTVRNSKSLKCEVCNKSFIRNTILKRHMRTHTGEKPYKCEFCNKSFSIKCNLTSHIRRHTGEKPHKCEICNKCFSQRSDLNRHIMTHTGEKPYTCDVCYKPFNQNSDLKKHIRTHTGEKPYECHICNKSFSDKSSSAKHMRRHTEKPHRCEVCNKCFSHSNNLIHHMQSHKEVALILII